VEKTGTLEWTRDGAEGCLEEKKNSTPRWPKHPQNTTEVKGKTDHLTGSDEGGMSYREKGKKEKEAIG